MKKLLLTLVFMTGYMPIAAFEPVYNGQVGDQVLHPLVWTNIERKASFIKHRQQREKNIDTAITVAKLATLAGAFLWLCAVLPPRDNITAITTNTTNTVQLPKDKQGFVLKTMIDSFWGATNLVATAFFMTTFNWLGGLAKKGGTTLANSVGIVCEKPVHTVDKYYGIVLELTTPTLSAAREYNTVTEGHKKLQQQEIIHTNITVLLQSIEIMLARMLVEVEVVRKQSKLSANAAYKVIRQLFEITNQSVLIINTRFEQQEGVLDVLEHWSAQLKEHGNRFKLFAWTSDY